MSTVRSDESLDAGDEWLAGVWLKSGVRLRQFPVLLEKKTLLVRWKPILGGVVVGFFILYQTSGAWGTGSMSPIIPMRFSALVLTLGAVFLLDDPAAVTIASAPASLRYRSSLRLVLVIPLIATAWAGQLVYVFVYATKTLHRDTARLLPTWELTLEMAAMVMTGLAIAAIATRWVPEGLGGVAAGPTLLGLLGAAMFLPHRWTLFPGSVNDPQWGAAHLRWMLIAVLATTILVYASRDPAGRSAGRLRFTPELK